MCALWCSRWSKDRVFTVSLKIASLIWLLKYFGGIEIQREVLSANWIKSVSMSEVIWDPCGTPTSHTDKEELFFKETYRKSNHRDRRLVFYSFIDKSQAYATVCSLVTLSRVLLMSWRQLRTCCIPCLKRNPYWWLGVILLRLVLNQLECPFGLKKVVPNLTEGKWVLSFLVRER